HLAGYVPLDSENTLYFQVLIVALCPQNRIVVDLAQARREAKIIAGNPDAAQQCVACGNLSVYAGYLSADRYLDNLQILEFGYMPDDLFCHPARNDGRFFRSSEVREGLNQKPWDVRLRRMRIRSLRY